MSCSFALPVFSGPANGVLPAAVVSGPRAWVGFDLTSDGGRSWELVSQRPVAVGQSLDGSSGYPLVSMATRSDWWVLGWGKNGLTTQVTSNGGTSWGQATARAPGGVPVALDALDADHALVTMERTSETTGTTSWLLATGNGGHSWERLALR